MIKLPPIDPEVIVILGVVGALATVGGYLAKKFAEAVGQQLEILPKLPPPPGM